MRILKPNGRQLETEDYATQEIFTDEMVTNLRLRPLPIPARIKDVSARDYDAVLGLGSQLYLCKKVEEGHLIKRALDTSRIR